MFRRLLFILSLLTCCTIQAYAQGQFSFQEEVHQFPPLVVGEKVTHVFRFKNSGTAPIIISKVDAGCGCTDITWTKDPVMPQDSGFVSVSYDSKGHEGNFFKNIHVYSNAKTPDYPLLIRGISLPDPENAPFALLPADTFDLGVLPKWTQVKKKIAIQNTGESYLTISEVTSDCRCVHLVSYAGMRIYAGKTKEIEIMYNPQQSGEEVIEPITLHTNSVKQPKIQIFFRSRVVNKRIEAENK